MVVAEDGAFGEGRPVEPIGRGGHTQSIPEVPAILESPREIGDLRSLVDNADAKLDLTGYVHDARGAIPADTVGGFHIAELGSNPVLVLGAVSVPDAKATGGLVAVQGQIRLETAILDTGDHWVWNPAVAVWFLHMAHGGGQRIYKVIVDEEVGTGAQDNRGGRLGGLSLRIEGGVFVAYWNILTGGEFLRRRRARESECEGYQHPTQEMAGDGMDYVHEQFSLVEASKVI